jgi:hypothetical protein
MVAGMKPGSVIVDLAAETGGNCELTQPGETIDAGGVTVAGPLNLASMGALHASEMYARNVYNFVSLLLKDGALALDWNDELLAKTVCQRFAWSSMRVRAVGIGVPAIADRGDDRSRSAGAELFPGRRRRAGGAPRAFAARTRARQTADERAAYDTSAAHRGYSMASAAASSDASHT